MSSMQKNDLLPQFFCSKTQAECFFHAKDLVNSKKSSNFAPDFDVKQINIYR